MIDVSRAEQDLALRPYQHLQAAVELELFSRNVSDLVVVFDTMGRLLEMEKRYVTATAGRLEIKSPRKGIFRCFVLAGTPSELAIYLAKSNTNDQQTIFAMQDCYLDELSDATDVAAGVQLFRLNALEIDRESVKLEQELEMSKLTEDRLDQTYLDNLIYAPLNAAIEMATTVVAAAQDELRMYRARLEVGAVTRTDAAQAEGRLAEKEILLSKTQSDKVQKDIEIQSQQRRFAADEKDLEERTQLNIKIRDLYIYKSQLAGKITYHTYRGGFLEKGDPICTIDA